MKLVDANVLLYAIDQNATHHGAAKAWLDAALSGQETVLMPWLSLLAFVRIATHHAIFERPLTTDQALTTVQSWLDQPAALVPSPDGSQAKRMLKLLNATGNGGNLVNDAYLASLALQYGATVVTFDSDFKRFEDLHVEVPAAAARP